MSIPYEAYKPLADARGSDPTGDRSNPTCNRSDPTCNRSDPTRQHSNPTRHHSNPTRHRSDPTCNRSDPTRHHSNPTGDRSNPSRDRQERSARLSMRVLRFLVCALLLAVSSARAQWGGELRLSLHSEPKSFHPALVDEDAGDMIRYLTGGVLVRVNRVTQQPEPALASAWKVLEGGRAIRFQLRPGGHILRWHAVHTGRCGLHHGSPHGPQSALAGRRLVSDGGRAGARLSRRRDCCILRFPRRWREALNCLTRYASSRGARH